MSKIYSVYRIIAIIPLVGALFWVGCSKQPAAEISGIWRSEDSVGSKNLVIEFVPNGTGTVFSGSIIGFPPDASMRWKMKGDQIHLETITDEPISQALTVLSHTESTLELEVNRTKVTMVRVDDLMDEDAIEALP